MRLAVMEWYTANILLVMRGPDDGNSGKEEGKAGAAAAAAAGNGSNSSSSSQGDDDKNGLLSKYMNVQAFLERTSGNAASNATSTLDEDGLDGGVSADGGGRDDASSIGEVEDDEGKVGSRGRCKYAPEDRERIRRERNRIHAKRTRDRRKKFMEESEKVSERVMNVSRWRKGRDVFLP